MRRYDSNFITEGMNTSPGWWGGEVSTLQQNGCFFLVGIFVIKNGISILWTLDRILT